MRKIFLALAFLGFMTAHGQNINREYTQHYTDQNILPGGDTLTRFVYGKLPLNNYQDSTIICEYVTVVHLTGFSTMIKKERKVAAYSDTLYVGATPYTFKQYYDMVVTVDEPNWQTGGWNIFLQFIN